LVGDGDGVEKSLTFSSASDPRSFLCDRPRKRVTSTTADDPDHVFSITMPSPTTFTSPTPTTFTSPPMPPSTTRNA